MFYNFFSESFVEKLESIPTAGKISKFIEEIELKSGEIAQIQLIITKNKSDFIPKEGNHFLGDEN